MSISEIFYNMTTTKSPLCRLVQKEINLFHWRFALFFIFFVIDTQTMFYIIASASIPIAMYASAIFKNMVTIRITIYNTCALRA